MTDAVATGRAVICNPQGLHARPSHAVVSLALEYESSLRVRCAGRDVNGKSILELMTLGAGEGETLEFEAQGRDCVPLIEALEALVQRGFGETS